jgi:hypothetical protein
MELLYFVLAAFGMTFIIVYSSIFERVREISTRYQFTGKLFHCPLCMGFWVGVFLWGISWNTELFTFSNSPVTAFICGCISAGTSYALSMIIGDYGINVMRQGGEQS